MRRAGHLTNLVRIVLHCHSLSRQKPSYGRYIVAEVRIKNNNNNNNSGCGCCCCCCCCFVVVVSLGALDAVGWATGRLSSL